jgi:hypothetical protein
MTLAQFARLAAELSAARPAARRTFELMAAGARAGAADAAGGRYSDDWWTAEFFVRRVTDHGATDAPRFTPAAPARRAPVLPMFDD